MTLAAGIRLGPYEISGPLGQGGMGEVYRARDTRLQRDVAIKVLPASFSKDTDRLRRFEQEARAAGILNHPNITAVYDIGTHEGSPYVVEELLEGGTLREALGGGRFSSRKAIDYALQIAHGLAAAHEKGIVHRDLKPENLFVTKSGRVKILDFGLAKLTRSESGVGPASKLPTETAGTEPGVVMGTLGYMSPEQVRGTAVDARSDIFSFGAILYEMLSGKRAFRKDTSADTMAAILNEDPPDLSVTNQSVSPGLDRIVRHCLEKNPEQRFHSAHDLAFDLEALSTASGQGSAIPGKSLRRTLRRCLAAAAAVAAALAIGIFVGARINGSKKTEAVSFRRLTFRQGNILFARFAPDGQNVVYSAGWDGKPAELFSVRTDSLESRPLGVSHADVLSISSKGELALKLEKGSLLEKWGIGTLARMPLGGSAPREILENVFAADWDPNGEDMAVVREGPEGKQRLEYPIGHMLYESFGLGANTRVSPSGDLLASFEIVDDLFELSVIDRKGVKRTLTKGWGLIQGFAWSRATGEIFFVAGKTLADRALRAVSLSGKERVLLPSGGGTRFFLHDVAADGRLLIEQSSERWGISSLAPGENRERELGWLGASVLTDISKDGQAILFYEPGEAGFLRTAIYLRKTDGSPAVRLGYGTPQGLSPDGRWALSLSPGSPPELELLPTGPGSPRKVRVEGITPEGGDFLPDGRIVVEHEAPGEPAIFSVVGPEGGRPTNISVPGFNAQMGLAFSPDSTRIAYATKERQVEIVPIAGGPPRAVPGANLDPDEPLGQWSADGRYLFTFMADDIPARIWRLDIETGKKTLWKEIHPADTSGFQSFSQLALTPDGRSYAYGYTRMQSCELYAVEGLK